MRMAHQFKKFHFQELGWTICFPNSGNHGKYSDYTVLFTNREKQPIQERCARLGEIRQVRIRGSFPHTVGFFKNSSGEGAEFRPEYMEIRFIGTVEDFWLFLNALNI